MADVKFSLRDFFGGIKGVLAVYFIAGAALLPFFFWQIDADGISYISIARRYIEGDFGGALNGYWGPLLSWLLAALMAAGIKPLAGAKLIGLVSGGLLLPGLSRLMKMAGVRKTLRAALCYAFIPVSLSYFVNVISPDLLVSVFVVWYLVYLGSDKYENTPVKAVYCGIMAALAFFSKGYALPFFLAHFTLVHLARYLRAPEKREVLLRRWLAGVMVFFFITAAWIVSVSFKYGPVTFSTTGAYNRNIVGPAYKGHPVNCEGLFEPKDAKALSVWEDPSQIPTRRWSVFSDEGFIHQLKLLVKNTGHTLFAFESISVFSVFILAGMLWLAIREIKRGAERPAMFFFLLAIAVYCGGYLLVTVRPRYLYPVYVLLFAGGAGFLEMLFCSGKFKPLVPRCAAVLFVASFLITPAANIAEAFGSGRQYFSSAGFIASRYGVEGNIASNSRWMESLYLTYWLNEFYRDKTLAGKPLFAPRHDSGYPKAGTRPPCYKGQLKRLMTYDAIYATLKEHGVDYLFVWGEPQFQLAQWREITGGSIKDLRIYTPR
ncbi:MAG: hypothetical protein WCS77_07025 [Elusimicrobiaceae bacterium]